MPGPTSGESASKKENASGLFADGLPGRILTFATSSRLLNEEFLTVELLPLELPDPFVLVGKAVELVVAEGDAA